MPSAKFNEVYAKTREIKTGPSNEELLNVRGGLPAGRSSCFALDRGDGMDKLRTMLM